MDGVGADGLAVTPTCVPPLQIDGVRTDADEDAVMEIDAVAVGSVGSVADGGVTCSLQGSTCRQG